MPTTITITELATALGISRQAIDSRRKKGDWQPTGEKVQGGGNKYVLEQLKLSKAELRKVLKWIESTAFHKAVAAAKETLPASTESNLPVTVQQSAIAIVQEAEIAGPATLKQWQRECMDARIFFMRLIEHAQVAGIGINRACKRLEEQSHSNELPSEAAHLVPIANKRSGKDNRTRALSASTLIKWWSTWLKANKDSQSLAPQDTEKKNLPTWAPYFLQKYQQPQKPSVMQAIENMSEGLPPEIRIPSDDQVYRFLKKFSQLDILKGRMTGAELKRKTGFTRRDTSELFPLDVAMCDGHSFKAYVAHPRHGRHFKPEVCAVLDAATCCVYDKYQQYPSL